MLSDEQMRADLFLVLEISISVLDLGMGKLKGELWANGNYCLVFVRRHAGADLDGVRSSSSFLSD